MNLENSRFLRDINAIIESHLSDENFGVAVLAKACGFSRSQLHRRLKKITGHSVGRYILHIRLSKARVLLEKGELNVSEVAYEVGFSSISYFCKCFKKYYGFTPGDLKMNDGYTSNLKRTNFNSFFEYIKRLYKRGVWNNLLWVNHPNLGNKLYISLFWVFVLFLISLFIIPNKRQSPANHNKSEKTQIELKGNIEPNAFDFYLKGEKWFNTYQSTNNEEHLAIAENFLNTSLSISPNYQQTFITLSKIQQVKGNLELMLNYAIRSIEIDPQYAEGYELIGLYHYMKGEGKMAQMNLVKSVDIKPSGISYLYLGLTYFNILNEPKMGQYYLAKKQVVTLIENDQELLLTVINAYLSIGDYKTSKFYIDQLPQCSSDFMTSTLFVVNKNIDGLRSFHNSDSNTALCKPGLVLNDFIIAFFDRDYKKCKESYFKWKSMEIELQGIYNENLDLSWYYISRLAGEGNKYNYILTETKVFAEQLISKGDGKGLYLMARIFALQNENQKALFYLKKYEEYGFRNGHHDLILIDPIFEEIRSNSEFQGLIARVQMEKSRIRHEIEKI